MDLFLLLPNLKSKNFVYKKFLNSIDEFKTGLWNYFSQFLTVDQKKRTGQHVVGDEKTSVTMVLNKILWLEINANTSSNERMPARHRSL